ncbi:hypothetical protein BH20ACT8_BH20ACT8_09690 [soil metagenome]
MTRPAARRLPRRSFATADPLSVDQAAEEVTRARETLERVRRAVGCGRDGAASLTSAEHALYVAHRRHEAALDQETTT